LLLAVCKFEPNDTTLPAPLSQVTADAVPVGRDAGTVQRQEAVEPVLPNRSDVVAGLPLEQDRALRKDDASGGAIDAVPPPAVLHCLLSLVDEAVSDDESDADVVVVSAGLLHAIS